VPNGANHVDALAAAIRSASGVTSVEAVPESEMRGTLERWLGPAAQSADLPVPALVNFDVMPGTALAPIEQRVHAIAPAARVSAHADRVGPLLRSMRALQLLALGLVLLLSGAAAAAVVLAARGAFDTHRSTIEVMHGIGATDLQLTHLFQRKIALDALLGSLVGAAAGALVLLLLASGASFAGALVGGATLSPLDLIALLLLPLVLTALATWVGRMAVLAALRETL
jgi:cell division transport system permease protein